MVSSGHCRIAGCLTNTPGKQNTTVLGTQVDTIGFPKPPSQQGSYLRVPIPEGSCLLYPPRFPVLPSKLSVAVLPPGQVWGGGRSGPSMPFHGGSITHPPLTSILSHRPGGLTGGDSAPETSVVPRTWKSGTEQVVWLHTL